MMTTCTKKKDWFGDYEMAQHVEEGKKKKQLYLRGWKEKVPNKEGLA